MPACKSYYFIRYNNLVTHESQKNLMASKNVCKMLYTFYKK